MKRVLIIDDEPQIRRLLRISLTGKDYDVFEAPTGFEGLQAVQTAKPDIVLLDLNLPDIDGGEVLRQLREWSTVPVIVLSVRNLEGDIVGLLNAGADDYLTKPFNLEELFARMSVALRHRLPSPGQTEIVVGRLRIDLDSRRVTVDGKDVRLTPTEYSILSYLARNHGKIVTQSQLLREFWGPIAEEEYGSLRVHIASLRKKIEADSARPDYIITEPGIGYRLQGPPSG
jgi:two-component system, OmpR family, KDP operon response regulator KdpE